jgi:hypothetical protein
MNHVELDRAYLYIGTLRSLRTTGSPPLVKTVAFVEGSPTAVVVEHQGESFIVRQNNLASMSVGFRKGAA